MNKFEVVENLIEKEKYKEAKDEIILLLEEYPDDSWLLTRLSTTYYELFDYENALYYAKLAYAISPNDPLILWDYACALDMLQKHMEAIDLWKRILNLGIEEIAYGEYGEGLKWGKSLYNDCNYRISMSYLDINQYKESIDYLNFHIEKRQRGISSLYSLREVKDKLKEIQKIINSTAHR
jgi:tetratricopeptide (TPR) repeat protein